MKTRLYMMLIAAALTNCSLAHSAQAKPANEPAKTEAPAEMDAVVDTPPPAIKLPPVRMEISRARALQEEIENAGPLAGSGHWFKEGTDDQYFGIYIEDHSGRPVGNVLILHDNQQHPDWPGVIHELRTQLPYGGWSTLAISIPDYLPISRVPERTLATPPADEAATADATGTPDLTPTPGKETTPKAKPTENPISEPESEPMIDLAAEFAKTTVQPMAILQSSVEYKPEQLLDVFDARMRDSIAFLHSKSNLPVIIIGVGLSAAFAANRAQSLLLRDVNGLVLIDPMEPDKESLSLDLDATDLKIPVLDIVPEQNPRSSAEQRKISATRLRHNAYELRVILGSQPRFEGFEAQIVKAVRGWGDRHFRR